MELRPAHEPRGDVAVKKEMQIDWRGVVLAAVLVTGCIVAAIFGKDEIALILVGVIGGQLGPSPVRRVEVAE